MTGRLARELSFGSLFFVVVANVVGTGIFTTSGFMMADLGRPANVLACWAVGGVLALAGALCYAELGVRFPAAGGEYVFLREAFGKRTGFLSGWVSLWVGFSAPIAAAAIAFGTHVSGALPESWRSPHAPKALAIVAIALLTLVHGRGLGLGARVQGALTVFKLTFLIGFVLLGLGFGHGSFAHFGLRTGGGEGAGVTAATAISWGGFAKSLIFVSFAYTGWNASAYLSGEARNPARDIPASILAGTGFVLLTYLAINVVFVYALPPVAMAGFNDVGRRAAMALFGVRTGEFFGLAIAGLLLSSIGALTLTGPRVYFAMAADGMFFRAFGKVDPRNHAPMPALLLQATIAVAMVLTSTFGALLTYVGFILSIFASLTVIGLVRLRMRERKAGADVGRLGYRTWFYPLPPILFVAANAWIVVFSVRDNALVVAAGGLTLLSGYFAARVFEKRLIRGA